jgi:hypothetical protein
MPENTPVEYDPRLVQGMRDLTSDYCTSVLPRVSVAKSSADPLEVLRWNELSHLEPDAQVMIVAAELIKLSMTGDIGADEEAVNDRMRALDEYSPPAIAERLAVLRHYRDLGRLPTDEVLGLLECDAYGLLCIMEIRNEIVRRAREDPSFNPNTVDNNWWQELSEFTVKEPTISVREHDALTKAEEMELNLKTRQLLREVSNYQTEAMKRMSIETGHTLTHNTWDTQWNPANIRRFISSEVRIAPEALAANLALLLSVCRGLRDEDAQEALLSDPTVVINAAITTIDSLGIKPTADVTTAIWGSVACERFATSIREQRAALEVLPFSERLQALAQLDERAKAFLWKLPQECDDARAKFVAFRTTVSDDKPHSSVRVHGHKFRR